MDMFGINGLPLPLRSGVLVALFASSTPSGTEPTLAGPTKVTLLPPLMFSSDDKMSLSSSATLERFPSFCRIFLEAVESVLCCDCV